MPPRPVRQKSRTDVRSRRSRVGRSHWGQWLYTVRQRRLRVGMVDRLSPIDRNLEATATSKTKKPNRRKKPPLARRAEPLGTMALLCMTPPLRVGMVDRLSPIDRNLDATATSKTKKPNSRKTPPLARRRGAIGDNGSTLHDAAACASAW